LERCAALAQNLDRRTAEVNTLIATWYATQNKTGLPTSHADSESEPAVNSD
jgi:hypothetical protein